MPPATGLTNATGIAGLVAQSNTSAALPSNWVFPRRNLIGVDVKLVANLRDGSIA
jgi:hypothetical protein